MRKLALVALGVALLAIPSVAFSGSNANSDYNFSRTFEFDPDHTGCPEAQWVNGAGLSDSTGNTNFGLVLEKNCALEVNASAGAVANSIRGNPATLLGYDLKDTSPCGGGAPRFNLLTEQGTFHFVGGCANGLEDATPLGDGWTRYRFQLNDPTDSFPVVAPGSTIESLIIIVDEPGHYDIDNIRVENKCAEKPGSSRACQPPL